VVAAGGAVTETQSNGPLPVLWHLRFSHYHEKARWALDYKGIQHQRRSLAPGTHILRARRLWGSPTTPVLQLGERKVGDSTAIIAELERLWPEPALYPSQESERQRALELEEHFDVELGPYIRGALFDAIIPDREVLVPVSVQGLGGGTRVAQNLMYPISRRILQRSLVDAPGGAETCRRKTLEALDRLEAELGEAEYLVGGRFTVADLTAAALFAPLVDPPEFPYEMPDPWPAEWEELRSSLADRPGYRWVGETYRRHRGDSAEVAG
jgi:glutathione S-transferase